MTSRDIICKYIDAHLVKVSRLQDLLRSLEVQKYDWTVETDRQREDVMWLIVGIEEEARGKIQR